MSQREPIRFKNKVAPFSLRKWAVVAILVMTGLTTTFGGNTVALAQNSIGAALRDTAERLANGAKTSYDQLKNTARPEISVTRWEENYTEGRQQLLARDANGVYKSVSDQSFEVTPDSFVCEDLLTKLQEFPLQQMTARHYISQEQVKVLTALRRRLNPRVFRFYESIGTLDTSDPKKVKVEDINLSTMMWAGVSGLGKTIATVWAVAAQYTTRFVKFHESKMPWQFDEEFAHVAVDREKIKLAWELGRAAKIEDGQFDTLVSLAATDMWKETMARGESLLDAYVFVHTLGPLQNRLFKQFKNPFTNAPVFLTYHAHKAGENEVLIARLYDLMAARQPQKVSHSIASIQKSVDGKISIEGAAEIAFQSAYATFVAMDTALPGVGSFEHPVQITNVTMVRELFMQPYLMKHGVFEKKDQVYLALSQLGADRVDGVFKAAADPTTAAIAHHNLVGISNIDPEMAKKNPDLAKVMLLATYFYYEKAYGGIFERLREQALQMMKFSITQQAPEIRTQVNQIPGGSALTVDWNNVSFKGEIHPTGLVKSDPGVNSRVATIKVFSVNDVRALAVARPDLVRVARGAFRAGNSQLQFLMESGF